MPSPTADGFALDRRAGVDQLLAVNGNSYRIQISSRYTSGTSVLPNGSADYDNVVLSPVDGNGSGGPDGNGLVRQKVRAGKVTATVYKTRRLIRRDR